jgi:peptide/nickel transport system substrate-binding protein
MRSSRLVKAGWTAALSAAALLVVAGCSSGGNPSTSPSNAQSATTKVKSGGQITFALDEDVAGWNVLMADDSEFVLAEIMDQIWPQTFIIDPDLKPHLNTAVATSAKLTKTNPQTVVYKINPKAKWSDGTPISAADYIYNWQAQSGNPKYKDKGGKAFIPATTSGYNQIKSVTGSNGGKTVTVVFSKPYSDWKALFAPMIPAHVAKKVGFNSGFQTFNSAVKVSGGPYMLQSYSKGEDVVEVPNPHYWGPKPKLSKQIYRFILNDDQQPPAVQNGEANIVNPALVSTTFYQSVKNIPNFNVQVLPGLEFQHIDFNQANPYLAKHAIRQAVAYCTNRPQMMQRIVAPLGVKNLQPLQNRIWMPTQPQFKDTSNGLGAYNPSKGKQLLQQAGMKMGSDGYFQPNFGPQKGKDFTLGISTTSGVPVRSQIEELFKASEKNCGIKINIQNYDANKLFGTVGPKGEFDMIEFAWVQSPFPSGNQSIYCSYTNTNVCGSNWDHYADPQVDKLFNKALTNVNTTQAAQQYNQIDSILWKDMATLPLFQQPQLFGWSANYGNIIPNTSSTGLPWNANQWGVSSQ